MRKSVNLIVTVAILLSAMLSTSIGSAQAANAKWTVMVYISGDNNLEDYVVKDIELELAPTGSSTNVQVVALADRAPGYDTSRAAFLFTDQKSMRAVSRMSRPASGA